MVRIKDNKSLSHKRVPVIGIARYRLGMDSNEIAIFADYRCYIVRGNAVDFLCVAVDRF